MKCPGQKLHFDPLTNITNIFSHLKTSSNFRPIKHIYVEDLDRRSRGSQTALRLTSQVSPTSIEINKNRPGREIICPLMKQFVSLAIIVLQLRFAIVDV